MTDFQTAARDDTVSRHPGTVHLVRLLEPNPHLSPRLLHIARRVADLRDALLEDLADGPELTAGLRYLLEAKDCFVRQALLDSEKPERL